MLKTSGTDRINKHMWVCSVLILQRADSQKVCTDEDTCMCVCVRYKLHICILHWNTSEAWRLSSGSSLISGHLGKGPVVLQSFTVMCLTPSHQQSDYNHHHSFITVAFLRWTLELDNRKFSMYPILLALKAVLTRQNEPFRPVLCPPGSGPGAAVQLYRVRSGLR